MEFYDFDFWCGRFVGQILIINETGSCSSKLVSLTTLLRGHLVKCFTLRGQLVKYFTSL